MIPPGKWGLMGWRGIALLLVSALLAAMLLLGRESPLPGRADLVIGNGTDPGTLHPHRATGIAEGRIIRAIHEGLVLLDPATLQAQPGCAQRWEILDGGTHYRFHLQPGLRWSDGTPLDAGDFLRSWLQLIDPLQGAPYGDLLEAVVGARRWRDGSGSASEVAIRSDEPLLLDIHFENPVPWFLYLCAQTPLQPVHPEAKGRAGPGVATNGPWIVESWRLRDRIRLVSNPHYRGPARPQLETIDFLAVESGNTQLNIFASGMSDWTVRVPAPAIPVLRTDPRWKPLWRADPYLAIAFYRLNLKRPPLDDPAIRRALSLSIDRRQLCQDVLGGDPEPAHGFVPWPAPAIELQRRKLRDRGIDVAISAPLPGYRGMALTTSEAGSSTVAEASTIDPSQWRQSGFDPQQARRILQQAGWQVPGSPGGRPIPPVELLHSTGGTNNIVAEWLQQSWHKELGLETRVRSMEWRSFLDVQRAVDYDLSRSSWIADYPDPATFLTLFTSNSPNSRTDWSDPDYDRYVAEALAQTDSSKREEAWQQAERILLERGPVLPLWSMTSGNLVSSEITGFFPNPLDQHDLRGIGRSSP